MNAMMADISDVITSHHAMVADLIECGKRMIVSSFGQLTNEGCKREELREFATYHIAGLLRSIMTRVNEGKQLSN